jgi:hypothetical protein
MKYFSDTTATVVLTMTTVVCFTCSVFLLSKIDIARGPGLIHESLYISSPSALKRMSLGYTGLLADIYWTRAVQYFGSHHRRSAEEYNLLYPLLDITTTLDPKLTVAYRFGATFLAEPPPQGAGQPEKAVALVKRGIERNPNDWRLYYDLGFLQAWELHDYLAASKSFEKGSQLPNSNPALKVLAAAYASRGGDLGTSRLLWRSTYETAANDTIRQNALQHLKSMKADDDVAALESAVEQYRQRTGSYPSSFSDLISVSLLPGIPLDPTGRPYKLVANGKIQVQDPDALPFITKGAPPGWKPKVFIPQR